MEEKNKEDTAMSKHPNTYNYEPSIDETIKEVDDVGNNGTYGESDVNQVNIGGINI